MVIANPPPADTQDAVLALPVVCLATANFDLTLRDVVQGKATVIDLWTTRCTRCPAALDQLNEKASSNAGAPNSIQFVSICCDKLDGAREIIERDETPRWNSMHHYFMEHEHKERAKELLGFKQVPFYIVFNAAGDMVFSGGKLPDLEELLNQKEEALPSSPPPTAKTTGTSAQSPNDVLFSVDDLDF